MHCFIYRLFYSVILLYSSLAVISNYFGPGFIFDKLEVGLFPHNFFINLLLSLGTP